MKTGLAVVLLLTPLAPSLLRARQADTVPSVSLHAAVLQGDTEAVRQYIEAGSDLNQRDPFGSTPLIIAATFGKTDPARMLLEAGADPNLTNDEGATGLHIAAFFGRTEIVKALLDHDANRYARDHVGNTAFDAVSAPFGDVVGIYDALAKALSPLGLELDYQRIRAARPRIAQMVRPRAEELAAVRYAPQPGADWQTSTPSRQGLDPALVAELYVDAAELSNLYGLLLVKNGTLIAEGYFNDGALERQNVLQSVTKSYTSALVGIALEQGCLSSVDQKLVEFLPEFAGRLDDPRKQQITIRDMLQMRSGFPWEERTPPYFTRLFLSDNWHWLPHVLDFPLTSNPGTVFAYSNLTSHLLGIVVARACRTDLRSYGQEHLFSPIGARVGRWRTDADHHNWGYGEISFTARDMAKFGLLYLRRGTFAGTRVLSADWVRESLQPYSQGMYDDAWRSESSHYLGPYFRNLGYGYQWWSARVGDHRIAFAWGHGGNLIVLLDDLDMIIVAAADPLYELPGEEGWRFEAAVLNLVGKFIASLPAG